MENLVKITPDLDISFFDLMCQVDTSQEFTLRDVLRAAVKSTHIPIEVMQEILQCRNILSYYNEAESKPFEVGNNSDGNIDYLELYLLGDASKDKDSPNGTYYSSQWSFHGVGKLGVVPDEDVRPLEPELKAEFRESYGIELSPLYQLTDYKIKIRNEIMITDWREKDFSKQLKKIDFKPSITLIEVLYWVLWELSFFGSPEKRDEENQELKRRVDQIEEAKKNGTLDSILIPWETVKADLEAKFNFKMDEDKLSQEDSDRKFIEENVDTVWECNPENNPEKTS